MRGRAACRYGRISFFFSLVVGGVLYFAVVAICMRHKSQNTEDIMDYCSRREWLAGRSQARAARAGFYERGRL